MAAKKFYQIGQVCKLTDLPHSTIRFWEKYFPMLQPMRSSGGHRYYSAEQVDLLIYLKQLLHNEGYTIDGAKKRLETEKKHDRDTTAEQAIPMAPVTENTLLVEMKNGLQEILTILKTK